MKQNTDEMMVDVVNADVNVDDNGVTDVKDERLEREIVSDGDPVVKEKTRKETEVLGSVDLTELTDGQVVEVKEGLVGQDKGGDGVSSPSLVTEVVDEGTGEDNVDVGTGNIENEVGVEEMNEESFRSTVEATTNGGKEFGNGDSKVAVDSQDSVKVLEIEDSKMGDEKAETLDQKVEVDQISKEVETDDALKSEDFKMDGESQVTEEIVVIDKKEDLETGLTKESADQRTGFVQEVADGDHVIDEKTVKEDVLNSSKISHLLTIASVGSEDDDVVIVDEGLEGKNEAQDSVSVELSLGCPDNRSLSTAVVNAGTGKVDQKVEVDSTGKDEVITAHKEPATNGGEGLTVDASNDIHGVLPVNSEFSYEEAHMDRGEDAGVDIDEVLGWKDEIPSLQPNGPPIKDEPADHLAGNNGYVQSAGPTLMGNQADMLSQLHLAAHDPMKGYSSLNNIDPFFKEQQAAVLSKKRKTANENDSYWTDRIIQNHPDDQVLQGNLNIRGTHQHMTYEQEKPPIKPARRSNKKRFFSSNHEIEANEQAERAMRRQQNLATEVLMKFADGVYFPSEIHLNKMFRRFGPLMESETEVDRQSGWARVVFKKCSDAEVAHSSAGTFNIFGSISVRYELNYTPMISYKPLPISSTQDPPLA